MTIITVVGTDLQLNSSLPWRERVRVRGNKNQKLKAKMTYENAKFTLTLILSHQGRGKKGRPSHQRERR